MRPLVRPSAVAELEQGDPRTITVENARRKARAVAALTAAEHERPRPPVLGCDTVVVLDGLLYGKPADEDAARATLRALGGRTHLVVSGLVIHQDGRERTATATTEVRFRESSSELIDWYVGTGEWRDRAGGYAIQGAGAALVREVRGDYENVVGLPVAALLDILPELLPVR